MAAPHNDEEDSKLTGNPTIMGSPEGDIPLVPSSKSDYYNMRHKNRGIALIFNHENCKSYPKRDGTDIDCKRITTTLKNLKFNVQSYKDLKCSEIRTTLAKVAGMDHRENDCLVIVVLSHGEPDKMAASDGLYDISDLWTPFTGSRCHSLVGKPKMFFFQACRGQNTDSGIMCRTETDGNTCYKSSKPLVKLPEISDFIFMHSTQFGNYSFRNPQDGSWFIEALCTELDARKKTHDLLTILTFVNRRLAYEYESFNSNESRNARKQVGSVIFSLTHLVHFYK